MLWSISCILLISTSLSLIVIVYTVMLWISQVMLVVKNPPASAGDTGDTGSIPGSGRSPGEGNGNPLQCCCLENPMDRGAWWASVHGLTRVGRELVTKQQRSVALKGLPASLSRGGLWHAWGSSTRSESHCCWPCPHYKPTTWMKSGEQKHTQTRLCINWLMKM